MKDRTGEEIDTDAEMPTSHDATHCPGFLGEDEFGRPIPCLDHRPELRKTLRYHHMPPEE